MDGDFQEAMTSAQCATFVFMWRKYPNTSTGELVDTAAKLGLSEIPLGQVLDSAREALGEEEWPLKSVVEGLKQSKPRISVNRKTAKKRKKKAKKRRPPSSYNVKSQKGRDLLDGEILWRISALGIAGGTTRVVHGEMPVTYDAVKRSIHRLVQKGKVVNIGKSTRPIWRAA